MRDYLKFYIDGKWVDPVSPKTLDVINPATEGVAGRISVGGAEDVDRAVKAARKAFETWSQTSREERMDLFMRIMAELKKRHEDMAKAIKAHSEDATSSTVHTVRVTILSIAFAGAGVPGGQVIGATDGQGGDVTDDMYTPYDYAASVYAKLGLGDELRLIRLFRQLGVQMMHVTYNRRNPLGDGCGARTSARVSARWSHRPRQLDAAGLHRPDVQGDRQIFAAGAWRAVARTLGRQKPSRSSVRAEGQHEERRAELHVPLQIAGALDGDVSHLLRSGVQDLRRTRSPGAKVARDRSPCAYRHLQSREGRHARGAERLSRSGGDEATLNLTGSCKGRCPR